MINEITSDILLADIKTVCPKSVKVADTVVGNFYKHSSKYEITTSKRIAAFIAQCAHESNQFTATREYASGSAYEGRKDLGNIYKGDGKKFKGRGYIQLTGRTNYNAMSNELFGDNRLVLNPELLDTPEYAMESAMVYWKWRNLNKYADIQYFETITKRINGGLNGFSERVLFYNGFCKLWGLPLYNIKTRSIVKN